MDTRTRIIVAAELAAQGLSVSAIARQLARHRETIGLWLKAIRIEGLPVFLDRYVAAKKGPRRVRQVPGTVKRLVWAIRAREHDCCGQKIQYCLACEQAIHLSVPKIYEILAERYILRPRGRTNQPRGVVPTATAPRGVIQMETVAFGEVFASTGVDIYTKEADVVLRPGLTSEDGAAFLHTAMIRRFTGSVQIVQTDGGRSSKARLPSWCHNIVHGIAVPVRTRKMNRRTSRVSTGPYARNAWGGTRIVLRSCPHPVTTCAQF